MADNMSTEAKHIAKLDLDVSEITTQLQTVEQEIQGFSERINNLNLDPFGNNNNGGGGNNRGGGINATIAGIESLNLAYRNFLNTLTKTRLNNTALGTIPTEAHNAAQSIETLTTAVQQQGGVTRENAEEFSRLTTQLKDLKGRLADAEAQARTTGEGFRVMGTDVQNSGNLLTDFVNKLTDKVKWLTAFQLIMMVEQAFSNVISTIKGTEDSVVELQRVLSEPTLTNPAIADELYRIAEQYGQTFENVQEAAVRFAQAGNNWTDTIKLTEAAMLGLNTAEIDVQNATVGLNAVMKQFGLDAGDMLNVIDKINITADNFSVTSQKIVAALQRAGGTASNVNLTLDETIGIITALSEATGRSGENIGTALNSLIIYTKKGSAMNVFAGLSENMADVVRQFEAGSASIIDVWSNLANEINSNTEVREALLNQLSMSDEYAQWEQELETEASDITSTLNDIYSTAGTYRQNYFISLLTNMNKYWDALENLNDAEGYSLQENEEYMKTLTAQYNQLVIAAKELAVQFGEAGFLDALKIIVQLSTAVSKLTKDLGGLRTILFALSTLIIAVKREQIASRVATLTTNVSSLGSRMIFLFNAVRTGTPAFTAYDIAVGNAVGTTTALGVATKFALPLITLIATAVSLAMGAFDSFKENQRQAQEEMVRTAQEAETAAVSIRELYNSMLELPAGVEKQQTQRDILEQLGYSKTAITELIEKYGSLRAALEAVMEEQNDFYRQQSEINLDAAKTDAIELTGNIFKIGPASTAAQRQATVAFQKIKEAIQSGASATEIIEMYDAIMQMYEDEGNTGADAYEKLKEARQGFVESILDYSNALETNQQYGDTWAETQSNIAAKEQELADAINATSGAVENVATSYEELSEILTAVDKKQKEINGEIDDFQSAYNTLTNVVSKYNSTGLMTVDMLQSLLELNPKYIQLLDIGSNSLSVNQSRTASLITQNNEYLKQLAALNTAEFYVNQIQTELAKSTDGIKVASNKASDAQVTLTNKASGLALAFLSENMSAQELYQSLHKLTGDVVGIDYAARQRIANATRAFAQQQAALINSAAKNITGYKTTNKEADKAAKAAKTAADKAQTAIEKQSDSLEKLIEKYKDLRTDIVRSDAPDAIKDKYIAAIDAVLAKLNKLDPKDITSGKVAQAIDDATKSLKKFDDEFDELDKASDKLRDLRSNFINLTSSIATGEVDALFMGDIPDRVNKANASLANLEKQLREGKLTVEEAIKAYQNLGAALDDLKDDYKIAQTQQKLYDKQVEAVEKRKKELVKKVQEQLKAEEQEEERSINAEIERYENRKKQTKDYYDGLIDALKNIKDENDKINKQMDYFVNRQKSLTNLEKAQSRSGLEAREQEVQYQQELAELEENWRRQLEDWNVEEQIKQYEAVRDAAIEDMDSIIDSLQAKISKIKEQLEEKLSLVSVDTLDDYKDYLDEVVDLSVLNADKILNYAKNGIGEVGDEISEVLINGVALATNNIDEAAADLLKEFQEKIINPIDQKVKEEQEVIFKSIIDNVNSTSTTLAETMRLQFVVPTMNNLKSEFNGACNHLVAQSATTASAMNNQFNKNLIEPLKASLQNVMATAMVDTDLKTGMLSASETRNFTSNNNMNLYANVNNAQSANNLTQLLSTQLRFLTNPSRM